MSRTRRIYLRDITDKVFVRPHDSNGRFALKNVRNKGVVLSRPVLRFSLVNGVFFEDTDLNQEFTSDVLFTDVVYERLKRGEVPRR